MILKHGKWIRAEGIIIMSLVSYFIQNKNSFYLIVKIKASGCGACKKESVYIPLEGKII